MIRGVVSTILMLVLLLLTSCFCPLTSVNPLSDPQHAIYDERIEGAWQLISEDKDLVFLHFGRGEVKKTKMISLEHKRNGDIDVVTFSVFPTLVDNQSYLNFNIRELFKEFDKELNGYTFMKYMLTNANTLTLSQIEEKQIVEAIKSGKLKGDISYKQTEDKQSNKKPTKCVKITDSSNNIIQYFQTVDSKKLFPKPMVFNKICPKR